jgi:radical SAM superfamily enzyme YgiQ (UPF0313 family)
MKRKIAKILLTQPNYSWEEKRTWTSPPYTLCLIKACLGKQYETIVFDPNFYNLSKEEVIKCLKEFKPDLMGVTSISTEYINASKKLNAILREALPDSIIVLGGIIPTVVIDEAMKDKNVDYWIMGEGEESFPALIEEVQQENPDFSKISGLAFWQDDKKVINRMTFIENLDSIPFPDYSNIVGNLGGKKLAISDYGNQRLKYAPNLLARNYPFALTLTSRGCPYNCVFCAGATVTGKKVRLRSAENVLAEIDELYKQGIREVIFPDDHFLASKKRAMDIMGGILQRGITWKCVNVTAWFLDKEVLDLMYKSGCNFLAISVESGNPHVVKNIIKKPVNLEKIPEICSYAKSLGFDIIANFVIGFPGETWEQIRDSFRYGEKLDVDIVNFHIATPLPKTELMDICIREGLLPDDFESNLSKYSGFGKGLIMTKDFTPFELEVIRSFEWDRINFSSEKRKEAVMRMNGLTREELENWRVNTRRNLGVNSRVANIVRSHKQTSESES